MPVSKEGLQFSRFLYKALPGVSSGGCHADVYAPTVPGSHPIGKLMPWSGSSPALYIHGGGFCTGDSSTVFVGHTKYLLDRGVCVVSIDYRLIPHVTLKEQREDWLDAYRWVKQTLPTLLSIDCSRVFAFGGSAGGTAVLLLGADISASGLTPLQAIYSVYPAVNWDTMWSQRPTVDYNKIAEVIAEEIPERQKLIRDFMSGPPETGYDFLGRIKERDGDGRWCWYMMVARAQFLVSCLLRHPGPPYPPRDSFLDLATPAFPPTVFVKALGDAVLDPEQTSAAYHHLQELGVDTKQIEAEGMLHGDLEGENDMPLHPPREEYFWREVCNVALDWCIEKMGTGSSRKSRGASFTVVNGSMKVLA